MPDFQLLDDTDVQQAFATHLRRLREQAKLSRTGLAERSSVPAPTIKKFELTGQISWRQLLLLWQNLDDLKRLYDLTKSNASASVMPTSIEEILKKDVYCSGNTLTFGFASPVILLIRYITMSPLIKNPAANPQDFRYAVKEWIFFTTKTSSPLTYLSC